jgi:hypothetical protein
MFLKACSNIGFLLAQIRSKHPPYEKRVGGAPGFFVNPRRLFAVPDSSAMLNEEGVHLTRKLRLTGCFQTHGRGRPLTTMAGSS